MSNIEVEIRSFISKEQYNALLEFFNKNAKLSKEDNQVTTYFKGEHDLRIQKNDFFSKIWLKKGKTFHNEFRDELQINFDNKDYSKLESLFTILGYEMAAKWYRKRFQYDREDIKVCIDYTKGYGYIIELEKMSDGSDKDDILKLLKSKLELLGIELTPESLFQERYLYYLDNWKDLVDQD